MVWTLSLIFWSLSICCFKNYQLASETLLGGLVLVLAFIVFLRLAFRLSNIELAIDEE
jgi:F0F1-type ATP synthase assembly protein I